MQRPSVIGSSLFPRLQTDPCPCSRHARLSQCPFLLDIFSLGIFWNPSRNMIEGPCTCHVVVPMPTPPDSSQFGHESSNPDLQQYQVCQSLSSTFIITTQSQWLFGKHPCRYSAILYFQLSLPAFHVKSAAKSDCGWHCVGSVIGLILYRALPP